MYFTVEAGTATFTPSATSAVVTSTLAVPSTSAGSLTVTGPSGTSTAKSNGAIPAFGSSSGVVGLLAGLIALAGM